MTQSVAAAAEQISVMASEPTSFEHVPSYHGHGQWVAKWKLADGPDGSAEMATVYVSHWKARKQYAAAVNRTQDSVHQHGSSEFSSPMSMVYFAFEPVGRYSAKSHAAFAEKVVAMIRSGEVPEQVASKVAAKFNPATPV